MTTHILADTTTLTGRTLRHVTRSVDTIITTAIMPIAIMLLFVYVFGGAIDTGTESYVTYLLPGILLITIASGVSYTAYRLFLDLQSGIFERFQSMPIARPGVLWAHVLTSLVATLLSLVIVIGVALLMGFRTGAGILAWLAIVGILILFTLALTWLAVIPGLTATSVEGASAFSYPLILLPFVSSAFVPTHTMPGPVRWFAEQQPVTPIVNTIRDLLSRQPVGTSTSGVPWPGASACSQWPTSSRWPPTAARSRESGPLRASMDKPSGSRSAAMTTRTPTPPSRAGRSVGNRPCRRQHPCCSAARVRYRRSRRSVRGRGRRGDRITRRPFSFLGGRRFQFLEPGENELAICQPD